MDQTQVLVRLAQPYLIGRNAFATDLIICWKLKVYLTRVRVRTGTAMYIMLQECVGVREMDVLIVILIVSVKSQ